MTKPKTTVTQRKPTHQALEDAHAYAEAIVETVREPLLVLNGDLRIKSANRSFYQTFQVSPEETENRLLYELGNRQWDIPRLRELLEEILPRNTHFNDFEVEHEFPTIGRRTMLLNARQLRREGIGAHLILLAFEDISEHRLIEEVERQLAVRERVEAELRTLNETLRRRVAELDAFTYSVSHDLKEPLRAIEAFSRFLLDDYADRLDGRGQEYLLRLGNAATRMSRLIEDVLKLARVSRQSSPPARVDLARVVGEAIGAMRHTIDAKGATVEVEDGLPQVVAYPPWVEQIFINLIANALKFNESERPHVEVGVRDTEGGMATLYVQDNGIGIDPQYQERIFGMFQRLHRREEYEGTGAGLAIVKRVVENLGGRVWLESELGAGATFLFTLPLWTEAAASSEWKIAQT